MQTTVVNWTDMRALYGGSRKMPAARPQELLNLRLTSLDQDFQEKMPFHRACGRNIDGISAHQLEDTLRDAEATSKKTGLSDARTRTRNFIS